MSGESPPAPVSPPPLVIDWGTSSPEGEGRGRAATGLPRLAAGFRTLWRRWMGPPRPRRSRRTRGLGGEACESRVTMSHLGLPWSLEAIVPPASHSGSPSR
jgi:hypothetical protein